MLTDTVSPFQIEELIHCELKELLQDKNQVLPAFRKETKLNAELGISSLEFARLIAILEEKLQRDPFREHISITSIRTVNDLVTAYQSIVHEAV